MCDVEGETKIFADKLNHMIIKGQIKEIKKSFKEFEKLGYKIFYEKITEKTYKDIDKFGNALNKFFIQGDNLLSKKGVYYQGVITRIPKKYYYLNKNTSGKFFMTEQAPMEEYILTKASQYNSLYINWVCNSHSKPIKDKNLYIFTVYLTDKKKLLQRAKQGDEAARTTVWFSINDPCKLKQSAPKTTPDKWVDEMIKVNNI